MTQETKPPTDRSWLAKSAVIVLVVAAVAFGLGWISPVPAWFHHGEGGAHLHNCLNPSDVLSAEYADLEFGTAFYDDEASPEEIAQRCGWGVLEAQTRTIACHLIATLDGLEPRLTPNVRWDLRLSVDGEPWRRVSATEIQLQPEGYEGNDMVNETWLYNLAQGWNPETWVFPRPPIEELCRNPLYHNIVWPRSYWLDADYKPYD
jgi:hypothetical protein